MLESENPYVDGQILFESDTGGDSGTLELKTDGIYEIICVGGGSGCSLTYHSGYGGASVTGGSGAGFDLKLRLTKGKYSYYVGNGSAGVYNDNYPANLSNSTSSQNGENSYFGNNIAYGAGGATSIYNGSGLVVGSGGAMPSISDSIVETIFNTNGNDGLSAWTNQAGTLTGGASVFDEYGKGGGASWTYQYYSRTLENGTGGYIKVKFISKE